VNGWPGRDFHLATIWHAHEGHESKEALAPPSDNFAHQEVESLAWAKTVGLYADIPEDLRNGKFVGWIKITR
jgi:hypothetical protein